MAGTILESPSLDVIIAGLLEVAWLAEVVLKSGDDGCCVVRVIVKTKLVEESDPGTGGPGGGGFGPGGAGHRGGRFGCGGAGPGGGGFGPAGAEPGGGGLGPAGGEFGPGGGGPGDGRF